MLNSLILVGGIIFFLWLFFSKKNLRHLFTAIFLAGLILSQWPFFLPYKIVLAIASFTAAGCIIYESPYKKGIKACSEMVFIYIFLFILFGVLFLGETVISYKSN